MACIKTNAAGKLVVELFSGKILTVPELVELDGQWTFFNQVVRVCQEALADFTQTQLGDHSKTFAPEQKGRGLSLARCGDYRLNRAVSHEK